ncbi:MAG: type II toxin-antitoxin system VapC family toxin [Chloroflexi bacterium]|nr:type II toxin-antitoxin system VapC family toxin [Chloroflexota bacterium]
MSPTLLDTDTLSEVIKGRNARVRQRAKEYLADHGQFTFSIITRYEILRGLKAKRANRQVAAFEVRCRESNVLPLTDEIVVAAAEIYADLYRTGRLISDADILIAATAIVHGLTLVTNNTRHFDRIKGLTTQSWVAD